MQTEFVRSLNCNYERILLDGMPEENKYQYCILSRGGIRGLLPCSLRYINGLAYLYYDISSKQNVRQLYSTRCIDRAWIKDFFWSFRQIGQELERFLLDVRNVLWYPEQIYQELESNVFSFFYIPYYEDDGGFKQLLEFWVERMDYNDELLVDCIYHIYEQLERSGAVYLQSQIFEDAKRLDLPEVKAAGMEPEPEPEKESLINIPISERDMSEQKKHFFGIFEGRKRRNKEIRENYRQDMQELMSGHAVAEDTPYETEYGRTVYIEDAELENVGRQICTPEGRTLAKIDKSVITIGKKKGDADVVLEDSSVSRLHARILKNDDICYIEDLNSTNGTFKNGLRLQPYEKRKLERGDEIRAGKVMMIFR